MLFKKHYKIVYITSLVLLQCYLNMIYCYKMIKLTNTKLPQTIINYTNLQLVRYRKPIWLPTAKTKLFRIPQRPQIPPEDSEELKRLYNNYRTQIKSLRNYFTQKFSIEHSQQSDIKHSQDFEEDFRKCNDINNEWNEQVKLQREIRVAKELEESIVIAKQRIEDNKRKQFETLQNAEEMVRHEIEASKDFITADKLDEAIEYAINNPVDYNYALDTDGTIIYGRENTDRAKIKQ